RIIDMLHSEFAMTDLGSLNYFFGISAQQTTSGILAAALQYLTFTGPNLSYVIQQVCLYHDPYEPHFNALKRILRYVRVTRCSTSSYCVILGDILLSSSAKRQVMLSRSSAKEE
ncbi:ribonuclease H-like domain-containing protein, partial [Tanacetum coccineum]